MTVARRIWLVRHAPTDWTGRRWCGRSDPELSEAGLAAADRLAAELAADLADEPAILQGAIVILSSPSRRAVQTAQAITRALATPIHVEPDLAEVDFGAADGLTWDELVAAHPALADALLAGSNPDWPGGETAAAAAARARSMGDRLLERAATAAVVAVTHGGLLPLIASHLDGDISHASFEPASFRRLDPTRIG